VSQNNRDLLTKTYGFSGNMVVIPNPVSDDPIAHFSDEQRREIIGRFGIGERRFHALTVARCHPQKGLDVLIEAVAMLPANKRRQIHFAIAGDGPDRSDLENRAIELGVENEFAFLGWQSQVRDFLTAFDLFVLPSRSEGQPFALAEALSAGLRAIASAVAGIPEMLDQGKGGDLVPSESPKELADALARFIDAPGTLAAKAEYGQKYVRRVHNATTNFTRTITLWDRE
jgi:glycosyltransferase involved in cell wall biosynthesis